MPSFLRLCGCTLLLAAYSSIANPTSMQFDNPASIEARGGVDMLLNPLGTVLHPLEMALTNGQRMARGLPLNKPTLRRAGVYFPLYICVAYLNMWLPRRTQPT